MNKNYTIISNLDNKYEIEDDNLIIVEDNEDTKQSTVGELKKCFNGDYKDPSENKFYSSQKIQEIVNNIKRELSTYASDEELKAIERRIDNIVISSGSDNTIILDSLNARIEQDKLYANDKYMEKVRKVIEGKEVSTGMHGFINVYVNNMTGNSTNVIFKSKNKLNTKNNTDTAQVTYSNTGFTYSQKNDITEVSLKLGTSMPKGTYFFFANIKYDTLFRDKGNIKLAVKNNKDDSAYTEFTYNQNGKFEFTAPKAFDEIKLLFNKDKSLYLENATVTYDNIMIVTEEEYGDTYIPYYNDTVSVAKNTYITDYDNQNYDISCSDSNATLRVEYYDKSITTETIQKDINELKSVIIDKRDKCGLIENYGEYLFFDNAEIDKATESSCRLSYDNDKFMRNGVPSLKVTFNEDVDINPLFKIPMNNYVENIDSVSLVFYIDRTTSYFFTTQTPISIYLCSDSYNEPEMVNYFKVDLNKSELVQGWNIIKRNITEFSPVGSPNVHSIKYVKVEVAKNFGLDNKDIYFNSVIFNQKMKPTVLLAFDGIYEEGVSYTYPYLTNRGIPATILCNDRTTYDRPTLETIMDLRINHGWDIGQYGCNPNKERLTYDDNPREQYLALRNTMSWLNDNLISNPISYSAPYGNLRPISIPILKDLGFKIAKSNAIGYCNFFDPKYDFALPMILLSNETTEEEIISKLQYAIDNETCICLYTNNVTEYGNEADAKKIALEKVIEFITENKDKITPMTFAEFYNKCNK